MSRNGLSRREFLKTAAAATAGFAAFSAGTALAESARSPARQEVTMQFWAEGEWEGWVADQIEQFQEAKPGTTIEFVTFKWGEMTPKLLTASAGGAAPNITIQDRFRMAGWASRGGATPLDDFVEQYNVDPEAYWPATWAEAVWQGTVYSIPWETDGRFLYWNKDLVEAAGFDPETTPPSHDWDAIKDMAQKLTTTTDDGAVDIMGFVPSQALNYGNGGDYVYAWANGGEFLKDERTAWMDNPKLVETLQWQLDVVNAVGGMDKAAEFAAGWPTTAGYSPFGAGKLAMMVNGDWMLSNFAQYYPDINFGMAPWRMRNDEESSIGFAGGFCLAVPAGAKDIPTTYEFLSQLISFEAQVDIGIRAQVIPCLKEAALSEDLINSSPFPELRKLANESMEYANFRPVSPVAQLIQDLWTFPGTGRDWVLYGQKTPEEACADMQAEVQKALDEFWATVQ